MKNRTRLSLTVTTSLFLVGTLVATEAIAADLYTKLLIHSNTYDGDPNFIDSSPNNHSISAYGGVHHSTIRAKFGSSSIYFPSGDTYLRLADNSDWNFGTGDFTIDYWVNFPDAASHSVMVNHGESVTDRWYSETWEGKATFVLREPGNPVFDERVRLTSANALWSNRWYHYAVVRSGSQFKLFLDGHLEASALSPGGIAVYSATLDIGWDENSPGGYTGFTGYIDEFRISKGIARWTSDFTPPGEPLCTYPIEGDLNRDCRVDFLDVARMLAQWLECSLDPPEACWE